MDGSLKEVAVRGAVISSNAGALRLGALAGLGTALLADWLIGRDLATGALINLLPDHPATPTSFDTGAWLLYPSREYIPRKTRAAIDLLRKHLSGAG